MHGIFFVIKGKQQSLLRNYVRCDVRRTDVTEVSKGGYDSCSGTNHPIEGIQDGKRYFTPAASPATAPQTCMKLEVTV